MEAVGLTDGAQDDSIAGRSVLVTGAYGLLGGWLVRRLLSAGARVTVVRRDEVAHSAMLLMGLEPLVSVVRGDICELGLLERVLAEHEIEDVFHLAAQTIVSTAGRAPLSTFETNIRGTWLLLEACRRHGAERVIVASSDKAYGPSSDLP